MTPPTTPTRSHIYQKRFYGVKRSSSLTALATHGLTALKRKPSTRCPMMSLPIDRADGVMILHRRRRLTGIESFLKSSFHSRPALRVLCDGFHGLTGVAPLIPLEEHKSHTTRHWTQQLSPVSRKCSATVVLNFLTVVLTKSHCIYTRKSSFIFFNTSKKTNSFDKCVIQWQKHC